MFVNIRKTIARKYARDYIADRSSVRNMYFIGFLHPRPSFVLVQQ